MKAATERKKKHATRASIQSAASLLGLPLDKVVELAARGQLKARRFRNRIQIDVLSVYDEYLLNWDSVLAYAKTQKEQQTAKRISDDAAATGEHKVLDITRRGSR